MVVTLFRSRLTSLAGDDYTAMAGEMLVRARTYRRTLLARRHELERQER